MSEDAHGCGRVRVKQQARRRMIIRAAELCFAEKGLHGASVADISQAAGLSVGQLYRVFISKEEIIEAIVRKIVVVRLHGMIAENDDLDYKAALLSGMVSPEGKILSVTCFLMEVSAEASRNPRLRAVLNEADYRFKGEGLRLIARRYPHIAAEKAAAIIELFAVLTEGTDIRRRLSVLPPTTKQTLEDLYCKLFRQLFSEDGS
ncbi:TPA: TetR/AcrR family transcriptional regulator [Klebsiella oxytoca]